MTSLIEFACPVCGNPLYKSKYKNRKKTVFHCQWCKHLVDSDGNEVVYNRSKKSDPYMNTFENQKNG